MHRKKLINTRNRIILICLLIIVLNSCYSSNSKEVIINELFSGYSNNLSSDTLKFNENYPLGEINLKIVMYENVVTEDSIYIFFESIYASKCTEFINYSSFEIIKDGELKLNLKEMIPAYYGRFKLVIPQKDTIINIAIKSYKYDYAFASYKIKIE